MNETFLGGENPMYKLAASLFYKLLLVFSEIENLRKGKHLKFTIQYTYTKPITQISRNCQRRFPACNVLNRNIDGQQLIMYLKRSQKIFDRVKNKENPR